MSTPDVPDIPAGPLKIYEEPEPIDTAGTSAALNGLLAGETITDANDRRILGNAVAFLETGACRADLAGMRKHASAVGEVTAGYDMTGGTAPPEVDAAYRQLTVLECRFFIDAIGAALRQTPPDMTSIRESLRLAFPVARLVLALWKDNSLVQELTLLQARTDSL